MGMLIDGQWSTEDRTIRDGAYVRPASPFGAAVSVDVIQGISAEPGRFHLIASLSCPWSHRLTLVRAMKRLDALLPLHIAGGPRTQGYRMGTAQKPWHIPGAEKSIEHLHELYTLTDPRLTARTTVPVLWDAQERKIVSNESASLLPAFDAVQQKTDANSVEWCLAPHHLRHDIDALSDTIQTGLSNGVYRAGKAQRQDVYEAAVDEVFATLDMLEARLAHTRYLHGSAPTTTDVRLWPTLARFDLVYHGHFKCARRRLTEYVNLWAYARDLFSWPGIAETYSSDAILRAYYGEDRDINPTGIVAVAPHIDWRAPHGRERFGDRMVWAQNGECISLKDAGIDPSPTT